MEEHNNANHHDNMIPRYFQGIKNTISESPKES